MATLELEKAAEDLVALRITGMRKGTDEPAYLHSFRVSQLLRERGYSGEVCLAGLLHDVVEDGGVAYRALKKAGFTRRTVEIVRLVSHDPRFANNDARWAMMLAGLIRARDPEAWAVKLADVLDNVRGSNTMEPVRAKFFREVKAPFTLAVSADLMGESELWQALRALTWGESTAVPIPIAKKSGSRRRV